MRCVWGWMDAGEGAGGGGRLAVLVGKERSRVWF